MNRYAAIDIGSNSVLLLAVEEDREAGPKVLADTKRSLRLAEGFNEGDNLSELAVSRLTSVLEDFSASLNEMRIDSVVVCATQLFRAAANGEAVAQTINSRFGWKVKIISGEEEARLSYIAAATGLSEVPQRRAVIDVGGGSTEIIYGCDDRIDFSRSFPVGAVSVSDRFDLGEPAARETLKRVRKYVRESISDEVAAEIGQNRLTIVVGGTAMTLAALYESTKDFDPNRLHGVKLTKNWLEKECRTLAEISVQQREALMPFDPDRAPIIVGGCLIIEKLLELLQVQEIRVSNRGLRWGALASEFALSLDF